jgi:hypothetical protein
MKSNIGKPIFMKSSQEIILKTNHFPLSLTGINDINGGLQQYHIEFIPEISERTKFKQIYRELREQLKSIYQRYYIFGNSLFSIKFVAEEQTLVTPKTSDPNEKEFYTLKIKKTRNFTNLSDINANTSENIKVKAHYDMVVKAILRENRNYINFRNQFYDYDKGEKIGDSKYDFNN